MERAPRLVPVIIDRVEIHVRELLLDVACTRARRGCRKGRERYRRDGHVRSVFSFRVLYTGVATIRKMSRRDRETIVR